MPFRPRTAYDKSSNYYEGLKTIQTELFKLRKGVVDLNYWRDAIQWMGRVCSLLRERNFTLKCLTIMHEIVESHFNSCQNIKEEVISNLCRLEDLSINDIDVLEKLLWVLANVTDKLEDNCLRFSSRILQILFTMGDTIKSRVEILPSFIRLVGREDSQTLLRSLLDALCRYPDLSGKVLWTIADQIPFRSHENTDEDIYIFACQSFAETSNLKAKIHLLQALKRITSLGIASKEVQTMFKESLEQCSNWLNLEMSTEYDLDPQLYQKYIALLKMELESVELI